MLLGLKRRYVKFCVNRIYAGTNPKHWEKKRHLLNSIGHVIGAGTKVVGPVKLYGKLKTGENVWLGEGFTLHGLGEVCIGDNCDIGPDVTCLTGSHEIGNHDRRAGEGTTKDIQIGNGCWIGGRSTLVAGVQIADGSVLAAGACAVKNIPADCLAGGIPAKEIRSLG